MRRQKQGCNLIGNGAGEAERKNTAVVSLLNKFPYAGNPGKIQYMRVTREILASEI